MYKLSKPNWKIRLLLKSLKINVVELKDLMVGKYETGTYQQVAKAVIGGNKIEINFNLLEYNGANQQTIDRIYLHEICHCLDNANYGFRECNDNDHETIQQNLIKESIGTYGAEILSKIFRIDIDIEEGRESLQAHYRALK